MKGKLAITALLLAVFGLVGIAPATADKPLRADKALEFQGDPVVPWEGTLTFDDGNGAVVYGIRFVHVDTGKPWGEDPKPNHKPLFFGEEWQVYTLEPSGDFDDLVMWGTDIGSGNAGNFKGTANGVVTAVDSSVDYEGVGVIDDSLTGRNLHWTGEATFIEIPDVGPVPAFFDGPFRIN